MNQWTLILVAAAVSNALRAAPLLLMRRIALAPDGKVARLLEHGACAVMGGIIFATLYGAESADIAASAQTGSGVVRGLCALAAFGLALATRNAVASSLLCLAAYAALLGWSHA